MDIKFSSHYNRLKEQEEKDAQFAEQMTKKYEQEMQDAQEIILKLEKEKQFCFFFFLFSPSHRLSQSFL